MTDNDHDACQSKKSLTLQSEVALPKSRPPVEAWDEIRSSGLLDRVSHRGKRALYSDGARAWMTAGKHLGIKCYQVSHQRKEFCRSLSEVDPKLSKKAGTQVIDRKWKALKDFLPSNYHRKINGPHGSQVNPRMRQRVFQFCWRNSLKWPSPAQFLKQLAKLQGKKCSGVSFQDGEKLPPLPDVWFPMGKIPKWWFRNQATHGPVTI